MKKDHEEMMKNVPLLVRGNSFDEGKGTSNNQGALNKTAATGIGLENKYLN